MAFQFPTLAKDFPFPVTKLVEADSSESINACITKLQENNILSLPVYDSEKKEYKGWFNISDLVPVFLELDRYIKNLPAEELGEDVVKHSKNFPFNHKEFSVMLGSESPVGFLFDINISPLFPWKIFYEDSPMSEIIQSLATDNVKRVPILSKKTMRVVKIISQSSIMQFVDQTIKKITREDPTFNLPSVFESAAEDLNMLNKVVVLEENQPVEDALKVMQESKHSAVGIVEEDGSLLSCISAKDLLMFRSLESIALNRLKVQKARLAERNEDEDGEPVNAVKALADLSVTDFISFVRQQEIHKRPNARAGVVTIRKETTLLRVIAKMSKSKVHRLFIVDDKKNPIGVASVRDVIRKLFS